MRTANDMRALTAEVTGEMHRLLAPLGRRIRIMEVCGTHTVAIFRAGLRQILPEEIELVSGPGCPVCVTHDAYIDAAIAYAGQEDVIITTFGDMLKVPGSTSSLAAAQAAGADVRVVYSPLDALVVAAAHPEKKIVFLAVGFETTAPTEAAAVLAAERQGLTNFFLLSAQKLVPPVMRALLDDPTAQVDGFLLPGHVAVVTGTRLLTSSPRTIMCRASSADFAPTRSCAPFICSCANWRWAKRASRTPTGASCALREIPPRRRRWIASTNPRTPRGAGLA